jgi:membrane protein implicated in regulation of membrane protease activity
VSPAPGERRAPIAPALVIMLGLLAFVVGAGTAALTVEWSPLIVGTTLLGVSVIIAMITSYLLDARASRR